MFSWDLSQAYERSRRGPNGDPSALAWWLAAETAARFTVSHGIYPHPIQHEGLGYYGIALVQEDCWGRGLVELGRFTSHGNVENWLRGLPGDHGLELERRARQGASPSSLLTEALDHLSFSPTPEVSHVGCLHQRRGASFVLVFSLVALIALHTGGDVWAVFQPRPAPGYFSFLGASRNVRLGGDGTVIRPPGRGSYWTRYMRGASIQDLREDLAGLLGA